MNISPIADAISSIGSNQYQNIKAISNDIELATEEGKPVDASVVMQSMGVGNNIDYSV